MSAGEQDGKKTAGYARTVEIALLAVVLYVLSPGPVVMLTDRGNSGTVLRWVQIGYAPLEFAFEFLPRSWKNAYDHYLDWCDALGHHR